MIDRRTHATNPIAKQSIAVALESMVVPLYRFALEKQLIAVQLESIAPALRPERARMQFIRVPGQCMGRMRQRIGVTMQLGGVPL